MMTMDESDRTRLVRSSLVALVFWLLLGTGLAVIPMAARKPAEPKFATVRLTLNELQPRAPVEPATTAVPASESAAAPATASATPAPRAVSRTAKAASKSAATKAAATKAAAQSSTAGGLGIPNFTTPVTGNSQNDSSGEYLDFTSEERLQRSAPAAPAVSEFEGVAAPLSTPTASKPAATSTAGTRASTGSASGETERALGEIAQTRTGTDARTGTGQSGSTDSKTTGTKASGASASKASTAPSMAALAFSGAPRKLITPAEPSIVLPDDLARLITSNRTVEVAFTIRADGSVPAVLVGFTPSAALPAQVRDWLAREFSKWRFEKGGEDGQARFTYSIKVE